MGLYMRLNTKGGRPPHPQNIGNEAFALEVGLSAKAVKRLGGAPYLKSLNADSRAVLINAALKTKGCRTVLACNPKGESMDGIQGEAAGNGSSE